MPEGWCWCTISDICSKIGSGSTPRGSNYAEAGIPFFRSQNVYNDGLVYEDIKYIAEDVHKSMIGTEVLPKDLLLNITGGSLGRCAIVPNDFERGNVSQHVCILRTVQILPEYLHCFIISDYFSETMILSGSGREGLPKYSLEAMMLPIPPLSEQRRIVTSIGRWLSIADILDDNTEQVSKAVESAKAKILDLAIHGKLVPQDLTDEPASELLKRINPKVNISCDNPHYEQVPFEIPSNWVWATLGDIANYGKCSTVPVDDIDEESWVLELEDIEKDSAKVIKLCTKSDRDIKGVRHSFLQGYVLYSKLRTYLNKVLVANKDGFCTTEIIPIKCSSAVIPNYLCNVLRAPYFLDYTAQCGYGVKMPRLSTSDARKALIPLPPINEQLKICNTIEILSSNIDRIVKELG